MMTNKPASRPRTILNEGKLLSEEERQELARLERELWLKEDAEKWVEDRLNEIYSLAKLNKNISRTLCERAAHCAYGNTELTDLIKEKVKKKRGRPQKTLPDWLFLLHYAHAMLESNSNFEEARRKFIGYLHNKNPENLENELIKDMTPSIENRISEKVTAYRNGEIKIPFDGNKLPNWAETVIHARITRGDKNKKRN